MKWHVHRGEAFAFLRELDDATIDAMITDPPYSSGGFTRGDRSNPAAQKYQASKVKAENVGTDFSGDNRDQRGYLAWCTLWLSEAFRVLKSGAPVVLFTDWRQLPITTDALQAGGFVWRGIAPWTKKNNTRPVMGRFRADAEFAVWGSKGPMPQREDVGCLPGSFSAAPVHHANRLHLTEKPLEVMRDIVRVCPPGGVILDPFCGSGTTGAAALEMGRSFVGCELGEEYHATATARLEECARARA